MVMHWKSKWHTLKLTSLLLVKFDLRCRSENWLCNILEHHLHVFDDIYLMMLLATCIVMWEIRFLWSYLLCRSRFLCDCFLFHMLSILVEGVSFTYGRFLCIYLSLVTLVLGCNFGKKELQSWMHQYEHGILHPNSVIIGSVLMLKLFLRHRMPFDIHLPT